MCAAMLNERKNRRIGSSKFLVIKKSSLKPRLRADGEGQTEAPLLKVSAGL